MPDEFIKPGDIVRVVFNSTGKVLCRTAVVIYVPAVGEGWIFKEKHTGIIHDVSEGCTVTKLRTLEEINASRGKAT